MVFRGYVAELAGTGLRFGTVLAGCMESMGPVWHNTYLPSHFSR